MHQAVTGEKTAQTRTSTWEGGTEPCLTATPDAAEAVLVRCWGVWALAVTGKPLRSDTIWPEEKKKSLNLAGISSPTISTFNKCFGKIQDFLHSLTLLILYPFFPLEIQLKSKIPQRLLEQEEFNFTITYQTSLHSWSRHLSPTGTSCLHEVPLDPQSSLEPCAVENKSKARKNGR